MKLKTLSRINRAVVVVLAILLLPFAIVGDVLDWLIKPFAWVCGDMQSSIQKRVGNRLLLMADEVRDGRIRNRHYLKHGTAVWVYRQWRDHHKFNDIPE